MVPFDLIQIQYVCIIINVAHRKDIYICNEGVKKVKQFHISSDGLRNAHDTVKP